MWDRPAASVRLPSAVIRTIPSWMRPRELAKLATSRLKPYPALAFSSAGGLTAVSGHRQSADCLEIWLSDLADALSLQS